MKWYSPALKAVLFLGGLILVSFTSFAQPANNPCSGAITLTSSSSCSNTAGTLVAATYTPPLTGCGATNKIDVWYSFVALSSTQTITVSSGPAQIRLQLFSGSCAALVSVACGNASIAAIGLTPGTTYYIRVFTQNNQTGTFNICVTHPTLANDNCAGAVSLTSNTSCINTAGTLNLSTATGGLPAGCQPVGTHYDVWYSFVAATTTETVTISSLGANITNPRIQLYSGTCAGLTSVACGTTTITQAGLTIGNTYYVRVANLAADPTGAGTVADFNICVTHTGPANDECAGAISLTPGASCVNTAGTLVGATYTTIPTIGCGVASRNDVWYSFVAATSSTIISLSSAPANSRIQVFSGSCGSLTSVACGTTSVTATGLTVGNTFYVRIYTDPSTESASNTFNICITNFTVANDDCSGAISLVSGSTCSNIAGTLIGSTITSGLPAGCQAVGSHYDVWYRFIAVSTTETITISSLGSNITNSEIQLYSGSCGTLTSVACGTTTITQAGLTIGQTYYVRVSNIGSGPATNGGFNICVTHTGLVNDVCAGAILLTSGYTCVNTTGTVANSTVTSTATACSGPTVKYDVWYTFVAQSTTPTITLSSVGANFSSPKIELFSGSCASLTSVACAAGLTLTPTVSVGVTYWVRIFSSTNPIPTTNANFDICITDPGPPSNDICSGATSLTSITATSCSSSTPGTLAYATSSSPSVASTCGTPGADVWYSFVAQSTFPTIRLTSIGTSIQSATGYIQLLSGSCGLFTSIACVSGTGSTLNLLPGGTGLTVGATYYVRVYVPTTNPSGSNWDYSICVTDPTSSSSATVEVSKSYVNVTKGTTGGSVEPGDILEIRATLVIRSGTIDSVAFYDTLENNRGFLLESSSLATKTNEGKTYKSFTDAFDSDAGKATQLSNLDTVIQMNLGPTASASFRGSLSNSSRPSFYGGTCIIMATYQVQVYAGYDTKVNWGGGAFTYKDGANMKISSLKNDSLVVYISPGLCSNAISTVNQVGIETDGTFSAPSGPVPLARNRGTSPAVPSYTYATFATGSGPQDYYYGVANNTSATYTTLNTYPKSGSVPQRVFNLWDIAGDHTGAANTAKGNNPCDINLPVSTSNPCGYMLVVNAAYKTDTAFRSTITDLCPNTYYEVSAWIKNICYKCGCDSVGRGAGTAGYIPFATNDSSGVQPNLAFQINGQDYYSTGNIPYMGTGAGITQFGSDSTNQWLKRGFVYKTEANQTSFELVIRNNAPGGGGNDWAIDDIVVASCAPIMSYSPSLTPAVCDSNTLRIYDTVRSSYENYTYYKWQRSTDGGANWTDVTGPLGPSTPAWNGTAWEYVTFYDIPPADVTMANSGDLYRMIVATTAANLSNADCQFTDVVSIITLDVIDCGTLLKTNFLSFNGKLVNDHANLSWSVTAETEPVSFEIERSHDGISFVPAGTVNSYSNSNAETNHYSFIDPLQVNGKTWYRIAMVGKSLNKKYSRIIQLVNGENQFGLVNLVNPFTDVMLFDIMTPGDGKINVALLDMTGRTIREKSFIVYSGVNGLSLDNTGNLPPGMYVLQIRHQDTFINRKVMKR